MNKTKLNYHVGLKTASIYKIVAAVVFFAVMANLVNLGSFYKGNAIELNAAALQAETELGRIYNKLNLPMKIIGDLFNSEKGFASGEDDSAAGGSQYAVLSQMKRNFSELSKKGSYIPVKDMKIMQPADPDIGQAGAINRLLSNESVRTLLLILILMSVLPRGIPVKIKNFINTIFVCPVFIFLNKAGIFRFIRNANGGSK